MPTTIKLKNSVTTTNAPSSLAQGEVAINITDKKVWVGNAATTPIQLLGDGGSVTFTSLTVTGVSTFSAGTVSAPSITTSGDTNTGIFFPAADTIAFTEGGVEAMRIDSSGNLLVGTTSSSFTANVIIEANHTTDSAFVLKTGGTVRGYLYATSSELRLDCRSTNPLTFFTNGTERMRIDSSGNVGIGTSSPSYKLDVNGAIRSSGDGSSVALYAPADQALRQTGASGGAWYFDVATGGSTNGSFVWRSSNAYTSFMSLNSSGLTINGELSLNLPSSGGNIYLRGGSTLAEVHVRPASGKNGFISFTENAVADRWIVGIENGNSALLFKTGNPSSNTERMRITTGGEVLIGTTSGTQKLAVVYSSTNTNGVYSENSAANPTVDGSTVHANLSSGTGTNNTTAVLFRGRSGGSDRFYVYGNGNVVNTNNSYGTLSDRKLKTDIVPANSQWDDVKALANVMSKFKLISDDNQFTQLGWVAQDVQSISAGLVFETKAVDKDGKETGEVTLGINTSVAQLKAFKALGEALERIEKLEAEIALLKSK